MKPTTLAVSLVVGVALAACGGNDDDRASTTATAGPSTARTVSEVTVMLDWTPNTHHSGIYVARHQGWYEDAGLEVSIVEPSTGGVNEAVAAGRAEFGISVAESVLPARAAGVPVVSIATITPHNYSSLMSLAAEGITRPRDLEGKTYGGFGGALETELISQLVRCDGGDPDRVQFAEVGNVDYLVGLEQDRYDFVWVFSGWDALRARAVEGKQIAEMKFVDHTDCIPDWYTPLIVASEAMIGDHPDWVRAFLAATTRGYDFAAEQPAEAAAILLGAVPELDPALVEASAQFYAPLFTDNGQPWGLQDPEVWARFESFARTARLIDREVDTTEAFSNDFLPAGG